MDAALAYRTQSALEVAGAGLFPRHGPRNARLRIDVVDTGLAHDTSTFVVVLPWGIEGVIVARSRERLPSSIVMGGRRQRVIPRELPGLGHVGTVELVPDVTPLASPRHARKIAYLIGPLFRDAVARARSALMRA